MYIKDYDIINLLQSFYVLEQIEKSRKGKVVYRESTFFRIDTDDCVYVFDRELLKITILKILDQVYHSFRMQNNEAYNK